MNLWFEEIPPVEGRKKEKRLHLERLEKILSEVRLDGIAIPELGHEKSSSGDSIAVKPPRVETCSYALELHERFGVEVIPYRVVVARSIDGNVEWLKKARDSGVSYVVLAGTRGVEYRCKVEEVNTPARELGFNVGNIVIPSREGEASRVREKINSGASFFTSQILFEADKAKSLFAESPVEFYACFSPFSIPKHIPFAKDKLNCRIPEDVEKRLYSNMPGASLELAVDIYDDLARYGVNVLVSDMGAESNQSPSLLLLKHFRKFA